MDESNQYRNVFIIETPKDAYYGSRYNKELSKITFKRLSPNAYPANYGKIEKIDHKGEFVKTEGDLPDFFLVSKISFPADLCFLEPSLIHVGTFNCVDTKKNQKDDKHIYVLRDEGVEKCSFGLRTDLDHIRSFLLSVRGDFKVTGFTPGKECPYSLKRYFNLVDWETHSYWPEGFRGDESSYKHNPWNS